MQLISYTNKSALNVNSNVADVNKCNAADLNEIKTVVNANASESGNASDLQTTDKDSLVDAINEVNTNANSALSGLSSKQNTILTGTSLPGTVTNGAIFLLYS